MKEGKDNSSPITMEPHDLSQDLLTRGCPVCDCLSRTIFNFFCSWLSPFASDEKTQEGFGITLIGGY